MREFILAEIERLKASKDALIANVNAHNGAIEFAEVVLAKMSEPHVEEE